MRVLLVHNEYGRFSGEEAVFYHQAKVLSRAGFAVERFVKPGSEIRGWAKAKAFWTGIWSPRARTEFARRMRDFDPDVVQVQNLYPQISPSIGGVVRRSRAALVYSAHNFRVFCPTGLMLRDGQFCDKCGRGGEWHAVRHNCEGSLAKSVGYAVRNRVARETFFPAVQHFVVLSRFHQRVFTELGLPAAAMTVVPNMYQPGDEMRPGPDAGTEAKFVGYVGRMSPEKGIDVLLQAARQLPEEQFLCLGHLDRFKVGGEGVPGNVRFLGEIPRRELAAYFLRMKALVIPSTCHEGFPMTAIEAMSLGVPVIASQSGGLMDIIDDEVTGFLVPRGDARSLAAAIRRLCSDPELGRRVGAAARVKAREEYTEERWLSRMRRVYETAIAEKRRTG